ncbi:MAG: hypothetical protein WC250_00910 [Candidatus Paceibacterota bacterium]|jgi:hypothetical protein
MKTKSPSNLTPQEYIDWAISERAQKPKLIRSKFDTEVAKQHKLGNIPDDLFEKYKAALAQQETAIES